jgi:hypothetical protein
MQLPSLLLLCIAVGFGNLVVAEHIHDSIRKLCERFEGPKCILKNKAALVTTNTTIIATPKWNQANAQSGSKVPIVLLSRTPVWQPENVQAFLPPLQGVREKSSIKVAPFALISSTITKSKDAKVMQTHVSRTRTPLRPNSQLVRHSETKNGSLSQLLSLPAGKSPINSETLATTSFKECDPSLISSAVLNASKLLGSGGEGRVYRLDTNENFIYKECFKEC